MSSFATLRMTKTVNFSETVMQKELFAAVPAAAISNSFSQQKNSFLDRCRLSLRLDQTLALLIGLLVIYVFVFSFGVETGKRYSMAELRAERAKRERMTEELSRKIFENQQNAAPETKAGESPAPVIKTAKPADNEVPAKVSATKTASRPKDGPGTKPAGRYTIQTVTVASKNMAERELRKLAGKGHQAFVIPGGKKLQICVDGFESQKEASRTMKQLKNQGLIPADAYVRTIA